MSRKNLFILGLLAFVLIAGFVWLSNASAESPYTIRANSLQPTEENALEITMTCGGRTEALEVPKAKAKMHLFNRARVSSGCVKTGIRVAYGFEVTIATDRLHKSDGKHVDVTYTVTGR